MILIQFDYDDIKFINRVITVIKYIRDWIIFYISLFHFFKIYDKLNIVLFSYCYICYIYIYLFVSDVNYLDNLIWLIETGNYIFHNGYDNIIT